MKRNSIVKLLVVTLAAGLARLVFLREYAARLPFLGQPVLDAALYDQWARALTAGQPFVTGPFYHAPGYPVFLSIAYRILGPDPVRVVIVQAVFGVVTTLLTMLAARRLFGEREMLPAGLLMLGTGALYFVETRLLVETLSLLLGTASLYLTIVAESRAGTIASARTPASPRRGRLVAAAGAGLLAGLTAVVRPNLLLAPLVVTAVLLLSALRRRRPWALGAAYAAGLGLALLPTTAWNVAHGTATPIATNGGVNFYAGNYRGASGLYEDPPGFSGQVSRQEHEADSLAVAETGRSMSPAEESSWWFRRGVRDIAADPGRWFGLLAMKTRLLLTREEHEVNGNYGLEASRVMTLRLAAVPFSGLAALGVIGLWLAGAGASGRRRKAATSGASDVARPDEAGLPLVAPVSILVAVLVTGLLFFVMTRLRLAAVPPLAVLSAHALVRGWDAWRAGRRVAVLGLGAIIVALSALFWNSPLHAGRNARWEARLFTETARALEARDRLDAAGRAYAEALAIDPTEIGALMHLGERAVARRDLAGAIQYFERARDAAPDNIAARVNLGILYYQAHRPDDCNREMREAARRRPDVAAPWYYQGLVAAGSGRAAEAESNFRRALDRDPKMAGAHVRLIDLLLGAGRGREARDAAARAEQAGVALPPELAARLGAVAN